MNKMAKNTFFFTNLRNYVVLFKKKLSLIAFQIKIPSKLGIICFNTLKGLKGKLGGPLGKNITASVILYSGLYDDEELIDLHYCKPG